MFSRLNGAGVWEDEASWRPPPPQQQANNDDENLTTFKAMLDDEWYTYTNSNNNTNVNNIHSNQELVSASASADAACFSMEMKDFGCYSALVNPNPEPNILLNAMNSSSIFSLDPSQLHSFLSGHQNSQHHQQQALPSLAEVVGSSSFDATSSSINMDLHSNSSYLYGGSLFNAPLSRVQQGGFAVSGSSPRSTSTPSLSPHSQLGTPNLSPRIIPHTIAGDSRLFANTANLSNLLGTSGLGLSNFASSTPSPPPPHPPHAALQATTVRVPALNFNRSKMLRPLEIYPSVGAQPTLFQKRAALRQTGSCTASAGPSPLLDEGSPNAITSNNVNASPNAKGKRKLMLPIADNNNLNREEDVEESNGGSGVHYDTDDGTNNKFEEDGDDGMGSAGNNGNSDNNEFPGGDKGGGGVDKGKKKGLPAKNLMAERRRRKKLNDRLYMLRSVVPKISKMDRASILGDAIDYLKELLQRINDLHNELESTSQGPVVSGASSFHPLTPTMPALPCRVKEECSTSLPSPSVQPARVEVRTREGNALNIHMFCARRPGLLLSTMRALDGLGLDVQQAVISCFNGFALDVFRAEQSKGGDIAPEEIKAVLLHTASCHAAI